MYDCVDPPDHQVFLGVKDYEKQVANPVTLQTFLWISIEEKVPGSTCLLRVAQKTQPCSLIPMP